MKASRALPILIFFLCLLPVRSFAADSVHIPDGFIAVSDDASAVFTNPAGLAVRTGWHSFALQSYHIDDEFNRSYLSQSLGPLGLGFNYYKQDGRTFRTFTAGAGFKIGRQFFAGMSANWWWGDPLPREERLQLPPNYHGERFDRNPRGFSVDTGIIIRPYEQLSVSFMTRHLGDRDLPSHIRHSYEMGTAIRPFDSHLTVSFDGFVNVRDFEAQEYDRINFRAGVEIEPLDGVYLGATIDKDEYQTYGTRLNFYRFAARYDIQMYQEMVQTHNIGLVYTTHNLRTIMPNRRQLIEIVVQGKLGDETLGFSLLGPSSSTGLIEILEQLNKGLEDPEVEGVLLYIKPIDTGLIGGIGGLLQEIRQAILQVRRAGKRVLAYVEGGGSVSEYYLASAADVVVMPPATSVGGLGTLATVTRTRGFFEKLGVDWHYFAIGKYKSTFHELAEGITPEQEAQVNEIIDNLYNQMLTDIARERQFAPEDLETFAQGQYFTASQAQQLGLVDEIGFYDLAKVRLARLCNVGRYDPEAIEVIDIRKKVPFVTSWEVPPRVAVIGAYGDIETGRSGHNLIMGTRHIGSDTIVRLLEKIKEDPDIKAVVLRIDSSGGSAVASDVIWHTIQKVQQYGKPVVISMGDVAGSGGYWIASKGDSIFAMPATLTGSIGVAGSKPVFARLFEKLGLKEEVFARGEHADVPAMTHRMTEEEQQQVLDLMKEFYEMFVNKVAQGRNMSESRVRDIAEGRIYTGEQAKNVGLVDEMGGLTRAILSAAYMAGIEDNFETLFVREDDTFFPSRMLSNLATSLNIHTFVPGEIIRLQ